MSKANNPGSDDVTVIVVSWNSAPWIARCLQSLQAQTRKPTHVVVVDNDSSDGTADLVAAYPDVTLIRAGANLGFAAGNNLALRDCRTPFVALLNPDAFPEPDWLAQLLDVARSHPTAAAIGSRQLTWSASDVLDGTGDTYHMSGLVWRADWGVKQQARHLREKSIFSPCAAAALYRSDVVNAIGGFDEDYFCYVEDVDLGFRMRLLGYDAVYAPQAVVHHVGSATTGGSHSDFCVFHGHRNLVWTYVKNMPALLFWLFLPLHLLLNLVTLIRFTASGQGKCILSAKLAAVRGLPRMWRKRREIQRGRKIDSWMLLRALDTRLLPTRRNADAEAAGTRHD